MSSPSARVRKAAIIGAVIFPAIAVAIIALPQLLRKPTDLKPLGRVSDYAGVIGADMKRRIEDVSVNVEAATTVELFVVTVPSLGGRSVEEYAHELFNYWGIGKKDKDNGVLLLVAPKERRVRIEVGYGLESVLTDGKAGGIIRDVIVPYFKAGDIRSGILHGVTAIANVIDPRMTDFVQVEKSDSEVASESVSDKGDVTDKGSATDSAMASAAMPWSVKAGLVGFIALFVGIGFFFLGAGVGSKQVFGIVWGGFFGGMPLLAFDTSFAVGGFYEPFLVHIPLACVMFVLGWRQGRSKPKAFGRRASEGGWSWGGGSGSSSGGGSSGSGSGGGSSGGGGASGSW
ncbi:MAG: TPM domain-containing protein, partial [Elusimicrobiota bacterium]